MHGKSDHRRRPSARPLGRRWRRDRKPKRLRKDEIVDEATRLFAERGYEGASMADLAERVGLRKASLFHHFASKDVLYAAVLERSSLRSSAAIARARRATARSSSAPRRAERRDHRRVSREQPFAARLLVREAMDWGPVIREKLATTLHVLDAAYRFALAGQEAGAFGAPIRSSSS